jgi:hypothetical protein
MAFSTAVHLKDQLQSLAEHIAAVANPFEATTVIKLILRILYVIALVIVVFKMLQNVLKYLIQPVKYHACMSVLTLLQKAANYAGFGFSSSILENEYKDLYLMPEKYAQVKEEKGILGATDPKPEQTGYYKGVASSLLQQIKILFNADIYLLNGIIFLEPSKTYKKISNYELPQVEIKSFKTNASEFISNYLISYEIDGIDKNTVQNYLGTSVQSILTPISINQSNNVLMKGFSEVRLSFARASKKVEFSIVEDILDKILGVVDTIMNAIIDVVNGAISVVNKLIDLFNDIVKTLKNLGIKIKVKLNRIEKLKKTSLGDILDNRLGILEIEQDFTSVPKLMILDVNTNRKYTKISDRDKTLLNADVLYYKFHKNKTFLNNNQYKIYDKIKVPFCINDYYDLVESNFLSDNIEITNLEWSPLLGYAEISFKIPYIYTNNLQQKILIPNGK